MASQLKVIHSDPDILGGTPVFVGTRVPVQNLIDLLEAGNSLDDFLASFPTVTREQAVAALEIARKSLTDEPLAEDLLLTQFAENIRFYSDMRFKQLTLLMAGMTAAGAAFGSSQYAEHHGTIAIAAALFTAVMWIMENRSTLVLGHLS